MLRNLLSGLMGLAMLSGSTSALNSPGYVKHALIRASNPPNAAGSPLDNLIPTVGPAYGINVTIGTPPQHMQVQLDTGSSDIVILGSNICTAPQALCNPNGNYHIDAGSYNPSLSSTSTLVPGNLTISYGDTTEYNGSYYEETVSIASATVKNVTVGLIQSASAPPSLPFIGIVGLGYANGESIVTNSQTSPVPLLLEQMRSQSLIHTLTYSLYLNQKESANGEIIFGGLDTTKFSGDLTTVPVLANFTNPSRFIVSWTSLNFTTSDSNSIVLKSPVPALLDSGASAISLTPEIATAIYQGLGVAPDSSTLPCAYGATSGNFTFGFNDNPNAVINVPLSALIDPVYINGTAQTDEQGNALCRLSVDAAASEFIVLGDSFMRSGYFVFDLEDNVIAMAQAKLNATGSTDIKAILGIADLGAPAITTTVAVSALASQTTAVINTADAASATAATVALSSLTPTFPLGVSATATRSAGVSAATSKAAAVGVRAPGSGEGVLLFGAVGLLSLFGGSWLLLL